MQEWEFAEVVDQASEGILITDPMGTIVYVNQAFERTSGYARGEILGKNPRILKSGNHGSDFYHDLWTTILEGGVWRNRLYNRGRDGAIYEVDQTIAPIRAKDGTIRHFVAVARTATAGTADLESLYTAHRMEAIGELAAGIAHEINTPTQYIGDNIQFLKEAYGKLGPLLTKYRELSASLIAENPTHPLAGEIEALVRSTDLAFLLDEIPAAIDESLEGNKRVAAIVRAVREFVHPDAEDTIPVDINRAIASAIAIARNEWKYVANVKSDFDPELPQVLCVPDALNQVVLNILVNAAQAIAGAKSGSSGDKGTITVSTRHNDKEIEIRISDTGPGIPESIRSRIFEPFFTTKRPGKGTGQGLAIVHALVRERLEGSLQFESQVGKGTTFIVRIPLRPAEHS